jgi:hypothetical protein
MPSIARASGLAGLHGNALSLLKPARPTKRAKVELLAKALSITILDRFVRLSWSSNGSRIKLTTRYQLRQILLNGEPGTSGGITGLQCEPETLRFSGPCRMSPASFARAAKGEYQNLHRTLRQAGRIIFDLIFDFSPTPNHPTPTLTGPLLRVSELTLLPGHRLPNRAPEP